MSCELLSLYPIWSEAFFRSMPRMLARMLSASSVISLERLQLLGLSIEMIPGQHLHEGEGSSSIELSTDEGGRDQRLYLANELSVADESLLKVRLEYFVRGARKYFLPHIPLLEEGETRYVSGIDKGEIQDFFERLGLDNDALYDEKISRLLGKRAPAVPSQMVMAMLFDNLSLLAQERGLMFDGLNLSFRRSIKLGEALTLRYGSFHESFLCIIEGACGPYAAISARFSQGV